MLGAQRDAVAAAAREDEHRLGLLTSPSARAPPKGSAAVTLYLVASAPGMLEAKAVNMVPMPAVAVGM